MILAAGLTSENGAAQDAAPGFEDQPILEASEILEPALLKGRLHEVGGEVQTFGYANTYLLKSKYGVERVFGTAKLRVRVREIYALKEIEKVKATKEFRDAVTRAAKSPLLATKSLITNPVDTVTGVPRGAFNAVRGRVGGVLNKREKSEFEDRNVRALIGFSKAKRQLAHRLNVDPYTSNKDLQRELNGLAWASFAGDMSVTIALAAQSGTALLAAKGLMKIEDFAEAIRDNSPSELASANKKRLAAMGVSEEISGKLLNNVWFSPTLETAFVLILEQLGPASKKGRELLVHLATTAESEDDAIFYVQTARLISHYDRSVAKIVGITHYNGLPICYTGPGRVVVPLNWDHGAWTERATNAIAEIQSLPGEGNLVDLHIYASGVMTKRVKEELAARKVRLTESVFSLAPAPKAR